MDSSPAYGRLRWSMHGLLTEERAASIAWFQLRAVYACYPLLWLQSCPTRSLQRTEAEWTIRSPHSGHQRYTFLQDFLPKFMIMISLWFSPLRSRIYQTDCQWRKITRSRPYWWNGNGRDNWEPDSQPAGCFPLRRKPLESWHRHWRLLWLEYCGPRLFYVLFTLLRLWFILNCSYYIWNTLN